MQLVNHAMFSSALILAVSGASIAAAADAADKVDFATQIQPLLLENCAKCHGEKKKLGKLQLHTPDAIKSFHEEELLVAGKPDDSELYQRLTLPKDNKKRMPKGADPLPDEQLKLIRLWIEQGAVMTVSVDAPAVEESEPAESEKEITDAEELADVGPAAAESIQAIEAAGGSVMPLFGGSPLLQVSFAQSESPVDDAAIAALSAAADQIVWLNLKGAQASPAGYAELAKLQNLSQLHLELSTVNDAALANLAGLNRLKYLNIYETSVTDAGLAHLKGLARLQKLYVWKTKITYDAAMEISKAKEDLEVSLGWDHPEVARRRLAKQIEQVTAQDAESAKELETATQQLESAKKRKEEAANRLKGLQDELNKLNNPDAPAEGEEPPAEAPAEGETKA
ncbi:hypothetical protein OAS39_01845 [Pirellulales bacterium]|nr:hypothetical protein [Pirellulales bacterium]